MHPIVIAKKPNGTIRICLDPQDLNKVIQREYFQIPTVEEILKQLAGTKVFSTLDANQGFYQIKLTNESSKMCTFSTPMGGYRFLRMPFGISSAPEMFHKKFKQTFEGLDGVDTKEPLECSEVPDKPWQVVGTDLFYFQGKNYVLIVDYFSKFVEFVMIPKLTSSNTINAIKSNFSRHGVPETIRSDGGTQYTSEEFQKFVKEWNVKHIV